MNEIKYDKVTVEGGFWGEKQDLVRSVTNMAVYDRFKETGRIDAFQFGYKNGDVVKPHFFWDSDVAKWMEAGAYLLQKKQDPALENIIDMLVENIIKNQDQTGYFNIYFTVVEPDKRFKQRSAHELYCAGHLIEAAVAYYEATGKDSFLKAMCRYADYIEKVFTIEKSASFKTPGHPEIELALVRLYEATKEERYLNLSKFFVDNRGFGGEEYLFENKFYAQDHLPLREQTTAEGHAVRAMYLYSGMTDVAYYANDEELKKACKSIFEDIITKKMYITGGCGSAYRGEAFSIDYYLPNITAYSETCAAISLVFFAQRLLRLEVNSKYADIAERAMYNGTISGLSLDGDKFFYENPLEINRKLYHVNVAVNEEERLPITQRVKVFVCSCCPPNIIRFISGIGGYIFGEDSGTVYIHHYISGGYEDINIKTNYPNDGTVEITCGLKRKIALRLPSFSGSFTLNCPYTLKDGYLYIDYKKPVILKLDVTPVFLEANTKVFDDSGKVALMKGPVVYCAEAQDNKSNLWNLYVDTKTVPKEGFDEKLGVPTLTAKGWVKESGEELYNKACDSYRETEIRFIPYYAFANRGEDDMAVWIKRK